ncbi:hypothetical protein V6N13_002200 [Hibiscus sabdariffa]|uniref:Uncharacterized protein n=1 Tax=Hibiscus sabdariffa TaxID=183260 RepID=A0ABR2C408_9ROSI
MKKKRVGAHGCREGKADRDSDAKTTTDIISRNFIGVAWLELASLLFSSLLKYITVSAVVYAARVSLSTAFLFLNSFTKSVNFIILASFCSLSDGVGKYL